MSEEEPPRPLNFVLEWRGEGQERRVQSPRDEVAQLSQEAAAAEEGVVQPAAEGEVPPPLVEGPEGLAAESETGPEAAADESPEFFEWTAERERAIQRLLEASPEGALPTVHGQIAAIHQALKLGELEPQAAVLLLDEVDGYLARRIGAEERKVVVAHPAFLSARAEKLKAFSAYLEASGSLREFVSGGEAVHLDVAAYAADQGTAFLAAARQLLFEAEPPDEE